MPRDDSLFVQRIARGQLHLGARLPSRRASRLPNLCEEFGTYLFVRFNILYSEIMLSYSTAHNLPEHVRAQINRDTRALYPDATPPKASGKTQGNQCIGWKGRGESSDGPTFRGAG